MIKSILMRITALLWVFVAGCASHSQVVLNAERVVERSSQERPKYADRLSHEEDQYLFYTGQARHGDRSVSTRVAEADAIKRVLAAIQVRARAELSSAVNATGLDPDNMGQFIRDAVGYLVDNIEVQGLTSDKQYWEKVEKQVTRTSVNYLYDVWVEIRIDKSSYYQARDLAAAKASKEALSRAEIESQKQADDLLDRLRQVE